MSRKPAASWPQPDGLATTAVLEQRALPCGLPLIVDEQMRPVEPFSAVFWPGPHRVADEETWLNR